MPAISIKGTTNNVRGRKEGSSFVVERTIQGGTLVETYPTRRANGKQAPGEKVQLMAGDIEKIISGNTRELNSFANKVLDTEITKRKADVKKLDAKVKTLTNKLVATKRAKTTQAYVQTRMLNTMEQANQTTETTAGAQIGRLRGLIDEEKTKLATQVKKTKRIRGEREEERTKLATQVKRTNRIRGERKDLKEENEKSVQANTRLRGERKDLETELEKLKDEIVAKKEKKQANREKREKKAREEAAARATQGRTT
jgi:chromosome segregation ATPase